MPAPLRTPAALLLLVAFAGPAAHADPEEIVDEDYRFRLRRPGPTWRLLPEAEVQRLVPDAIAGAVSTGGHYGVVIAEAAPNVGPDALEGFARLVLDTMPLEDRTAPTFESTLFHDRPAVTTDVTGTIRGLRARYRHVIFLDRGFAFQLVAWAHAGRARPGALAAFADAFTPTEGEIRARTAARETADVVGVGWRVADGVFQSAVHGVAVAPPGEWRLAVGGELAQMNPAAEVGLVHATPEAYVALVVEVARGVDQDAFTRMVLGMGLEDMGVTAADAPYTVQILGQPVRMQRYVTGGTPAIVFHKGAFFVGDRCHQVLAWHLEGLGAQVRPLFAEAFASIRRLDPAETAALAAALAGATDPRERVGLGYVWRGGRYRGFDMGFTWTAPDGPWQAQTGQDARAENPDATLILENPALGLQATLIAERVGAMAPAELHRIAVTNVLGRPPAEEPTTVALGRVEGAVSGGVQERQGVPFAFRVVTALHQDRAFQLILYGTEGNIAAAEEAIEAAIAALEIHAPTPVVEHTPDGAGILDHRLGFGIRPPGAGWRHQDLTPSAIESLGAIHAFERGEAFVIALGVCALEEGQDARWFETLVARIAGAQMRRLGLGEPARTKTTVAGREAVRLDWIKGDETVSAFFLSRGRSLFALVGGPLAEGGLDAEAVLAGFALLE